MSSTFSAASFEESTGRIALPATLTAVASQKRVRVVVSKRSINIALYVCMQVILGIWYPTTHVHASSC